MKKNSPTDPTPGDSSPNGFRQRLFAALAAKALKAQGAIAFLRRAPKGERLDPGACPHRRTLHLQRPHPKYGDKVPYFRTVVASGCAEGCNGYPNTSGGPGTTITEKAVRRAPRSWPSSFETHKVVLPLGAFVRGESVRRAGTRVELRPEDAPVMLGSR